MNDKLIEKSTIQNLTEPEFITQVTGRLTALWALNEAALGGVLLAFKIPFTGLFIGSAAVILISLMAFFNNKPGAIIRATVIVLIIKGLVSPHTPITAYAAVMLQGLMGELFFRYLSWRSAAYILAGLSLLFSAVQKFLIITLIFGMSIWESIDLFGNYIVQIFYHSQQAVLALPISFSLIILYSIIHLSAGLIVAYFIPRLAYKIEKAVHNQKYSDLPIEVLPEEGVAPVKKHRRFFKKISAYILGFIVLAIMALSYIFPVFEESKGFAVIIMVFRSVMIMGVWYFILGPFVLKKLKAFLNREKHTYTNEVQNILDSFPALRRMVKYSWQQSASEKKHKRLLSFLFNLLVRIITTDLTRF